MSASAVLDVAYAMLAERADSDDRLIAAAGGVKQGDLRQREQLDRDLGLTGGGELIVVGDFSMAQLAERWGIG